jgi:hypothetical protein
MNALLEKLPFLLVYYTWFRKKISKPLMNFSQQSLEILKEKNNDKKTRYQQLRYLVYCLSYIPVSLSYSTRRSVIIPSLKNWCFLWGVGGGGKATSKLLSVFDYDLNMINKVRYKYHDANLFMSLYIYVHQ